MAQGRNFGFEKIVELHGKRPLVVVIVGGSYNFVLATVELTAFETSILRWIKLI